MHRTPLFLACALAVCIWLSGEVHAAAFVPGDVFVYRVGDGSTALSSAAAAVFVDEYDATGAHVGTFTLPTAVNGANHIFTAAGSATSEGLITLSLDGSALVLAGYNASVGTAAVAGTTAASINRVVGFIDPTGAIDTTTALADYANAASPRGVASTDGSSVWITSGATGATGGVHYTTRGATGSVQINSDITNLRGVGLFGGQLYISTSSGALRLGTVGVGEPTVGSQTTASLPGLPTATGSPYQFLLLDLNPGVAGVDTLYYADDGSTTGLTKYSFDGTTWSAKGNLTVTGNSLRGLSGYLDPDGNVQLFLTNPTTLFSFKDTTGFSGTLSGTPTALVSAGSNTAFRGVAVVAIPEPGAGCALTGGFGLLGAIRRRRA